MKPQKEDLKFLKIGLLMQIEQASMVIDQDPSNLDAITSRGNAIYMYDLIEWIMNGKTRESQAVFQIAVEMGKELKASCPVECEAAERNMTEHLGALSPADTTTTVILTPGSPVGKGN